MGPAHQVYFLLCWKCQIDQWIDLAENNFNDLKKCNFSVENKEHSGQSKNFEDEELAVLHQD